MMAESAREAHGLRQVVFVPTGNPPHKEDITPAWLRLLMAESAVEGRGRLFRLAGGDPAAGHHVHGGHAPRAAGGASGLGTSR